MDLLTQFDGIVISSSSRLDEKDRNHCEDLQKKFERTLNEIREWNSLFLEKQTEAPSPWVKNYYGVYEEKGNDKDDPFGNFQYAPLQGLLECSNKAGDLCLAFEKAIVDYFQSKYGAQLTCENKLTDILFGCKVSKNGYNIFYHRENTKTTFIFLPQDGETPSYEAVTDYIFNQLGGMSFHEKRDNDQLNEFGKKLRYSTISAKGRSVSLTGFVSLYHYFDGRIELNYDYRIYIDHIFNAIRLAFHEKDNANFEDIDKSNCFNLEIPLFGSEAAASLRIFKNGKISVNFLSSEQANTFYTFLENTQNRFRNL